MLLECKLNFEQCLMYTMIYTSKGDTCYLFAIRLQKLIFSKLFALITLVTDSSIFNSRYFVSHDPFIEESQHAAGGTCVALIGCFMIG